MAAPANINAGQIQAWLKEHPGCTTTDAIRALTQPPTQPLEHERLGVSLLVPDHLAILRAALDVGLPDDGATEEAVQREIEQALEGRGIVSPAYWLRRRKTPKLGEGFCYRTSQRRRSKVAEGLSDLVVAVVGWPLALMLEVKGRGAFKVSPEQRIAAEAGTLWIVRSGPQTLRLLDAFGSIVAPQLNCVTTIRRHLA